MSITAKPVPATSPAPAPLRRVGAVSDLPVTFDIRTAFDFAISLAMEVGEHDELPEEDRVWLERSRAALPERVRTTVEDELTIFAAGLVVDHPETTDAAGVVALMRATSGEAFARAVLAEELRDTERTADVLAALDGDREAAGRLVEGWPADKRSWITRLVDDPAGLVDDVVELLEAWLPAYQEMEPRIRSIIERDVALRAASRATLAPAQLVEKATNGIRWLSEPGVRRVVLAPSYLLRPFNFTFAGGDWRLFVYPVADGALEPHDPYAPPVALLRLHRALGDESRLRILRLLRDRDYYLTEIAERLDLSKPTIKHHLAHLRAAGLVTLTEEGGLSYYSLRRERLDDASSELKQYLT